VSELLTIDVRAEQLVARLLGAERAMLDSLKTAVDRLTIEVQSHVKARKLSGQALHVQTGTLRRSINRQTIVDGGTVIGTVGTNVRYAAVHEYGFRGNVSVRSHVRSTQSGGTANVRAHTRRVDLPARSFLRSTLAEDAENIRVVLRAAAVAALRGER
jgi:phage gpG-like protein